MAILSVNGPLNRGARSRRSLTGLGEYTFLYIVKTNSALDGMKTVEEANDGATAIPDYGDTFSYRNDSDSASILQFKETERTSDEAPFTWTVRCIYSTDADASFGEATNPLTYPPEREWDAIEFRRQATRDLNGDLILNSSNDLITGIEDDDALVIYRYTRNEAFENPSLYAAYQNVLNADSFKGVSPGFAKMKPIRARELTTNGITYWRTTYEVHFRREGWEQPILDAGLTQLVIEDGIFSRRAIMLKGYNAETGRRGSDVVATTPQFLDNDGGVLGQGLPPLTAPGNPKLRPRVPFSPLGIN